MSSFNSSLPVVPWRCRPFRLRQCCSAAACDVVRFVCARQRSAAGRRLSSLRYASSKPFPPGSVSFPCPKLSSIIAFGHIVEATSPMVGERIGELTSSLKTLYSLSFCLLSRAPIDARFAATRSSCRPLSIYHTCTTWMSSIGEMVVEMTQFGVGSGRLVLGCSMARRKSHASIELGVQRLKDFQNLPLESIRQGSSRLHV
ncbi:hypothetical protein PIB30_026409 [Stylosanthes scabra]|uniref:Uncharacterized protein n=1 Tax=Stylosanthes scabra TaxID=79078 RepID=A0ABU6SA56_9FABA|nr:hypothetical protein [Stylosanthes scabra]